VADTYIDQFETIAYGEFASRQIARMVLGMVPAFDGAIEHATKELSAATNAMEKALAKSASVTKATYRDDEENGGVVQRARETLRRAVRFVQSREDSDAIVAQMLQGMSLTSVLKQRPAKLPAKLQHAASVITKNKAVISEHAEWAKKLNAAAKEVSELNEQVRDARASAREMTPEVAAARTEWLLRYRVAKLVVEAALASAGKLHVMPEVFDDLAETHRAPGVSDSKPDDSSKPA